MTLDVFTDSYQAVLSNSVGLGDATIRVVGAAPTNLQSGQFRMQFGNEKMLVTGGQATSTWNVTRGIDGTSAATHNPGDTGNHYLFASALRRFAQTGSGLSIGDTDGTPLNSRILTTTSPVPGAAPSSLLVTDSSGNIISGPLTTAVAAPSSGQGFGTDIYAALANGGPKGDGSSFDAPAINALLATGKDVHLAGTGATYLIDAPLAPTAPRQKLHLHGSKLIRAPQVSTTITDATITGGTTNIFHAASTASLRVGQQIIILQGFILEIAAGNLPHTITAINPGTGAVQLDSNIVSTFTAGAVVYTSGFLLNIFQPNFEILGGEIDGGFTCTALASALSTSAPITSILVSQLTRSILSGTTVTVSAGLIGTLTSALTTGAPITSIPASQLSNGVVVPQTLPAGTTVTLSFPTGTGTVSQTFTVSGGGAAPGASSIPVNSQTPNFAYPASSTFISGPTQTWTLTAPASPSTEAALGVVSLAVASQTPNYNYPAYNTALTVGSPPVGAEFRTALEINIDYGADGFKLERTFIHDCASEGIVAVDCYDPRWESLRLQNCLGNGVHMGSSIALGVFAPRLMNCHIENTNLNPRLPHADGNIVLSRYVSDLGVHGCHMINGLCGIGSINESDNSDVTIMGGEIRYQQRNAIDGLVVGSPAKVVLIEGVRIYSCPSLRVSQTGGFGQEFLAPNAWTIKGNYLYQTPLVINVCRFMTIEGNTLDGDWDTTLKLLQLNGVKQSSITGNLILGGAYGIYWTAQGVYSTGNPNYLFDDTVSITDNICIGQALGGIWDMANNVRGASLHDNTVEAFGATTTASTGVVTGGNTLTDTILSPFSSGDVNKSITVGAVSTTILVVLSSSQVQTVSNALVNGSNVTYTFAPKFSASQTYIGILAPGIASVKANSVTLNRTGQAGVKLSGQSPSMRHNDVRIGYWTNVTAPDYRTTIVSEASLQSYWRLDEASGTINDSKGAITGTATGVTYGSTGLVSADPTNNAITFPGVVSDRIAFGDNYGFVGTASFSVEVWLSPSAYLSPGVIIGKSSAGVNNGGWRIELENNAQIKFFRGDGTTVDVCACSAAQGPQLNQTMHVIATYDGTNMRLYLNSVLVNTVASSRSVSSTTGTNLSVGAITNGASPFAGVLDDVSIYNAALSQAQITAHYAAGNMPRSILVAPAARGAIVHDNTVDVAVFDKGTSSDVAGNSVVKWANLCANPSFETDTSGWITSGIGSLATGAVLTRITTDHRPASPGTACGQVVTDGLAAAEGIAYQFGNAYSGQEYFVSAWLKGNAGGEQVDISISGASATLTLTTTWTRYFFPTGTATLATDGTGLVYLRGKVSSAITFFVDDVQITQTAFPLVYSDT